MVQHIPNALLLALLVGTPAIAVDYVKCDAIQRAYGRLSSERKETWLSIKNAKLKELGSSRCACGFLSQGEINPAKTKAIIHTL